MGIYNREESGVVNNICCRETLESSVVSVHSCMNKGFTLVTNIYVHLVAFRLL